MSKRKKPKHPRRTFLETWDEASPAPVVPPKQSTVSVAPHSFLGEIRPGDVLVVGTDDFSELAQRYEAIDRIIRVPGVTNQGYIRAY